MILYCPRAASDNAFCIWFSVRELLIELQRDGFKTRQRISKDGRTEGGGSFTRGGLMTVGEDTFDPHMVGADQILKEFGRQW